MSEPPRFILLDIVDNEIICFSSLDDVIGYVEVIDVEAGIYELYDIEGRKFPIYAADEEIRFGRLVNAEESMLYERLREFLIRIGEAQLAEEEFSLYDAAAVIARHESERHPFGNL